jgi:hypothetical protein
MGRKGRGVDSRGRGVGRRGRGVGRRERKGRGLDGKERSLDGKERSLDGKGRGLDGKGRDLDKRGRGLHLLVMEWNVDMRCSMGTRQGTAKKAHAGCNISNSGNSSSPMDNRRSCSKPKS